MPLFEPAGSVNISGAFTAKGDLLAGTGVGAYTALAVGGTNGWALVVDNTTATGMKWAAVSASATQVDRASGAAGDYLAKIKLTADTQYRMVFDLTGTSVPEMLLGPGGTTAPDLRIARWGTSTVRYDDNSAGNDLFVQYVAPTSAKGAYINANGGATGYGEFSVYLGAETKPRVLINSNSLIAWGPGGSTDVDNNLVRSGAGAMTFGANSVAATSVVLGLKPNVASAGSTLNLFNLTNANAAISLQTGTGSTPQIALGPGTAVADIYARRSAAKTLIVDTDGANGALTTVDFKTTNFYVNGSPITATATQVQRASGAVGDYIAQIKLTADTTYRLSAEVSSGGAPQFLMGGGGVTAADIRMYRSQAGRLVLDTNGSSVWTEWGMLATAGQRAKIDQRVSGDPEARLEFSGDATLTGVALGPGSAALDLRLYRSTTKTLTFDDNAAGAATLTIASTGTLNWGGAGLLDVNNAKLRIPVGAGISLTATDGYVGYDSTTDDVLVYDSQRQRVVGTVGWTPAAYPIGFDQSATYTTSLALAINGGSVAVAIEVTAHMRIVSISYYNGTGTGTTEAKLYRQYLNNGNGAENTLAEVTGAGFASRSNTASALQTVAVTTAGTYLAPGVYWLVLRNTSGSVVFALGSLAAGTMARPIAQTKTLGSALGSTLDFVAATWTKSNSVVGVRLNGEVFGQTTAF